MERIKNVKEAIKYLEEKKGIHLFDTSNIKYLFWDEYSNYDSTPPKAFLKVKNDEELLSWVNDLKQDEEEE